jgi:hypothetical protein
MLFFASCKKKSDSNNNNNNTGFKGCHITAIYDSSSIMGINNTTSIIYKNDGTPGTINTAGTANIARGIEYFGNTAVLHIAGDYVEIDTINISNGMISSLTAHYFTTPESHKVSNFTYDANGQVASRIDNFGNGTADTFSYTWQNGDLLYETSRVDSFIYTYDTSFAYQDGDWMKAYQVFTLGYGAVYIKTAHCVKSRRHNLNATQYFFYEKDVNNRIGTCHSYIGSSPETYNYIYTCVQ